ncbi:MAG: glycoside hydrolase family 99-like domain-containing protein [Planctomycetia bacterium]|nr:glycoside hydrolase family 99-like domain-containing protein [Planctomycetia bacterium]
MKKIVCGMLSLALCISAWGGEVGEVVKDIVYCAEAKERGVGDLYLPKNVSEKTPMALCIHGGGWSAMDRSGLAGVAEFLCENGFAVFNINYRLTGSGPWPLCGDDCLKAGDFLLNAPEVDKLAKIDRSKVFVIGASAGGHLALMTGLRLPAERVSGIVSISGIADLEADRLAHPGRYVPFLGKEPSEALWKDASPMSYIRKNQPPILLTHTIYDQVVPFASAKRFFDKSREVGANIAWYVYDRRDDGHCIWVPGSSPHRLHSDLEAAILNFYRGLNAPYAVPEPKPVKSAIELSAFYYPGTEQMAEWEMVKDTYPHIKPLLGWYDEGNPEVVDWQIKWAVEHGISSFFVDWYWNRGEQRLDHWVKGFYQAKYRSYLKWAVMWANHNEPGAHDEADMREVTRFWIANYFKTPEYYTREGKPVVLLWTVNNIEADMGLEKALAVSREEAVKAGLPGIYFIVVNYRPEQLEWLKRVGVNETTEYHNAGIAWWQCDKRKPGDTSQHYDFDVLVDVMEKRMASRQKLNVLPHIASLPTGWDDTPRSYQKARVIYGKTPEKFRRACETARAFCEKNGVRHLVLSPLNEWQEGSYIEPNAEFGFTLYDVLRDVFCEKPAEGFPENVAPKPEDVARYSFPPLYVGGEYTWVFDGDTEKGWYRQPYGAGLIRAGNGSLKLVRTGANRTAMQVKFLPFPAEKYTQLKVRMKVTPLKRDDLEMAKIRWSRTDSPIFDEHCVVREIQSQKIPILADGEFHEYVFQLNDDAEWKGEINAIWFDPCNRTHAKVEIEWIQFQ